MLTRTEEEIIRRAQEADAEAQARAAPPPPPPARSARPKDRVIRDGWNVSQRCLNQPNWLSTIEYMKATGAKYALVKDYRDVQ